MHTKEQNKKKQNNSRKHSLSYEISGLPFCSIKEATIPTS